MVYFQSDTVLITWPIVWNLIISVLNSDKTVLLSAGAVHTIFVPIIFIDLLLFYNSCKIQHDADETSAYF